MAAITLSASSVTPLGDRVLVKVSASEETTAGGILLPDTAKEKPQVGEITAVGPGKRNEDGAVRLPKLKQATKCCIPSTPVPTSSWVATSTCFCRRRHFGYVGVSDRCQVLGARYQELGFGSLGT